MGWQRRMKQYFKITVLIHIHYYLQYALFMFDVFFSETLTWQQQQHNVAASVIMTTNLNWRPPGVQNVRISCVPTVPRHHARSSSSKKHIVISMENYQKLPSYILSIKNRCTKHDNTYEFYGRFMATLVALCEQEMIIAIAKNYVLFLGIQKMRSHRRPLCI
jgi:hypothetical protein